jgi:hypothetical protein
MTDDAPAVGATPTTNGPHDRHVAAGYCPVVSRTKSWCCGRARHIGSHWSERIPTPGQSVGPENPRRVRWSE